MKKNTRGFTLIELLAVIIILGVLMLIAIPSVTQYISNSRKSTFISSGASYMNAVSIKVNNQGDQDGLTLTDPSKVYYIPVGNRSDQSCVKIEKGGKTPFGDWWVVPSGPVTAANATPVPVDNTSKFAYVIVVMNDTGTKYSYAFVARDTGNYEFAAAQEGTPDYIKENVKPGSTVTMPANGDPVTGLPADLTKTGTQEAQYFTYDPTTDTCVMVP